MANPNTQAHQYIELEIKLAAAEARAEQAEAELATYKRAYEALRDDVVDDECPFEYDLVNWSDCRTCPHDREMHNDRERDLKCWDRHYFEKAQAERGRECDCKHYLPLKEPMTHKVGWCAYKDEPIDDQEVGNCEARERGLE